MQALDFERVYTMTDWYDGPRGGIADFRGRPHVYSSLFDDDVFELRPIDGEHLRLALEDWQIWLRWERADRAGEAPPETHPALPADRARHEEIERELAKSEAAGPSIFAHGEFRPTTRFPEDGVGLEVAWKARHAMERNWWVELHDSEVERSERFGDELLVSLRAVVHASEKKPGIDVGSVWIWRGDLILESVEVHAQVVPFTISEGSIRIDDAILENGFTLEFDRSGDVTIELQGANGRLAATAKRVRFVTSGEPEYLERFGD